MTDAICSAALSAVLLVTYVAVWLAAHWLDREDDSNLAEEQDDE